MPPPEGHKGFRLFREVLNDPKYIVAPMVDASELAWRMLARKYGAQLCYTPMWHSGVFVRDEKYRKHALETCPEDRPLIVQFCANNPDIFKRAVELTLQGIHCDAIDLNLGCPQVIAKRGHFGSFLQEEWELISKLVSTIHDSFDIPITCKIRVFDDLQKTIDYAKMMESAGCQILTVHGRTRDQKGALTGLADWNKIKAVVDAVNIPVIANGNIQYFEDVQRCIDFTGVNGVMSAEGHLSNPAIFANIQPPSWQMALEYLDLVDRFPCPLSYARGHMFKLLHFLLQIKTNFHIRDIIARGQSLSEFRGAVLQLKEKYEPFHVGLKVYEPDAELAVFKLKSYPWICQPYVRPPPEEHLKKVENDLKKSKRPPEELPYESGQGISKNKLKKLERNPNKTFGKPRESCKLCLSCPNPCGTKCDMQLCKKCCKNKCFTQSLDCEGHKIWIKTKRAKFEATLRKAE